MNGKKILPSYPAEDTSFISERNQTWLQTEEVTSVHALQEDNEGGANVDEPVSVRPVNFETYLGQNSLKESLQIAVGAARQRKQPLDHVLLSGPPGLGKTSMARVIATELGAVFKSTSGPVIEKPGDLAAVLTTLEAGEVLFIDEIHRLPRVVEEVLYPAMEDFQIDIIIGAGAAAKSIKIDLKPFTLIGATTRTGLLTSPLRDRFGLAFRLNYYSPEELSKIIQRSAQILDMKVPENVAYKLGARARGTPRIANRLLRRLRDFAEQRAHGQISEQVLDDCLRLLEVDARGLDRMDRNILEIIIDRFEGGPVGLDTIAAAIGEDSGSLEDVYEPYLLQEGFISRTKRGREATKLAYLHLGRVLPVSIIKQDAQIDLKLG